MEGVKFKSQVNWSEWQASEDMLMEIRELQHFPHLTKVSNFSNIARR